MRILVTGAAGFVGSHLVEALRARGDDVVAVDLYDDAYDPALKRRNLPDALVGDVRDAAFLDRVFPGVDGVIHLAARAGVRESLREPQLYADVNVGGTAAVLAAMTRHGVRRMVFASSSSVYGVREGTFREDEPADTPASPYAASKRAAELFCAASGLDVTCVRLFTVYGPRQRPGMAIAKFVAQARAGEPITLFGDGSSVRDYTYVADAVAGLLAALDHTSGFHLVNLGGGAPIRLDGLVAAIGAALGTPPRLVHLPEQPGDVPATRADITVAQRWLGWAPQVSVEEGVRRYVAWVGRG